MGSKTRLVVLFGGRSAEHDVSCVTAVHVLKALDPERYDVVPIGITRGGQWVLAEDVQKALASGGSAALPAALAADGPVVDPLPALGGEGAEPGVPVVVLPLLHGPFGEDGTVQGLLELARLPYVGTGVLGSAVGMDKAMAKQVLAAAGIAQGRFVALREDDVAPGIADRLGAELGWPLFVKPANLGSSIGITKADNAEAFDAGLREALSYDEWVVVEETVRGREIEVAVLGNRDAEASLPGEVVPGHEFYDYEDKYLDDSARYVIPAQLGDDATAEVRALAVDVFRALRCEGLARVDFFYEEGGRGFLVNEVNTIPGFTPISMYPKLWEATGVGYRELLDRLVALAVERHARREGRIGRSR